MSMKLMRIGTEIGSSCFAGPIQRLHRSIWGTTTHSGDCGNRIHADCERLTVRLPHAHRVRCAAEEHGVHHHHHSQACRAPHFQAAGSIASLAIAGNPHRWIDPDLCQAGPSVRGRAALDPSVYCLTLQGSVKNAACHCGCRQLVRSPIALASRTPDHVSNPIMQS